MAYLDIRKGGKLVSRRLVSESAAEKGIRWKFGDAEYQMTLGETAKVGDYELVLLAGDPPARKKSPEKSSEKLASKTGSFAAINPQMVESEDTLDLAGDPNMPKVEGYEIKGRLGDGGMGTVWRAVQLSTKREVALKFLQERRLNSTKAQIRFEREVQLSARLEHPNIARIYDSGLSRGVYYYALELIRGESLDDYVSITGLNRKKILELMAKVCNAVQYAHAHGVIHRDLKPSNIMVSEDGQPHILDFGLAKSLLANEDDLTISKEGDVAGTPAYMAPEQAAGKASEITAKTDVYALGIMLYKLLLKNHPHDLTGPQYQVIQRIAEEEVKNPRDVDKKIDPELSALLMKSLAHNPEDRYVTAGELGKDIASYLAGEPLIAEEMTATVVIRRKIKKHQGKILMLAGVAAAFVAGIAITAVSLRPPSNNDAGSNNGQIAAQPQTNSVPTKHQPTIPPAGRDTPVKPVHTETQPVTVARQPQPENPPAANNITDWKKLEFEKSTDSARNPEPKVHFSSDLVEIPGLGPSKSSAGLTATNPSAADARYLILDLGNNVSMKLAPVPAGKFLMGSPENEKGRISSEGPQHEVTITKSFYMGIYSVTQSQMKTIMNAEPWNNYRPGNEDMPAVVTWDHAIEFCEKLSQKIGKKIRLPTEAEREYACRAGSQTRFYFGDDDSLLGQYAWLQRDATPREAIHRVGQKKPNAWGLYDMLGNISEWCLDGAARYENKPQTDPFGKGPSRVQRGAGYTDCPRSAFRTIVIPPAATNPSNPPIKPGGGFRVIVESDEPLKPISTHSAGENQPSVNNASQGQESSPAIGKETVIAVEPDKGFQYSGVDVVEGHFYSISVRGFWSSGVGSQKSEFGPEGPLTGSIQPDVLGQWPEDSLQAGIGGNPTEAQKCKIRVLRDTDFLAPASGKLFIGRTSQKNKLSGQFKVTIAETQNPWANTDTFSIRTKTDKVALLHIKRDGVFWEYPENPQTGQSGDDANYPTLVNNVMWWPKRLQGQKTSAVAGELKLLPEQGKLLVVTQSIRASKDNLVVTEKKNDRCVSIIKDNPEEFVLQFSNQQDSKWLEGDIKLVPPDYIPPSDQPAETRPFNPPNQGQNRPPLGPDGNPLPNPEGRPQPRPAPHPQPPQHR